MSESTEPRFDPAFWREVPLVLWLEATTHARIHGGEKVPYKIDEKGRSIVFYWSRNPEHREDIAVLTIEGKCFLNAKFFTPHVKFSPPETEH